MIWQALCSCGKKSPIHVCLGTMKSSEYVKCCLSRIKRLIKAHRSTSVLFWADLATIHYSKDAQKFYDDNGVMLVPKNHSVQKLMGGIKKKVRIFCKT